MYDENVEAIDDERRAKADIVGLTRTTIYRRLIPAWSSTVTC